MHPALQAEIDRERAVLSVSLRLLIGPIAGVCALVWDAPGKLDATLAAAIAHLAACRLLYTLDCEGRQCSSNVAPGRCEPQARGQDLSVRPFLSDVRMSDGFHLSPVYVSRVDHRPCLTALHQVHDAQGALLGCLAADFDLSSLPSNVETGPRAAFDWRQIRGDPAIRQNLFQQQRVPSPMDEQMQAVHDTIVSLMIHRGVFHAKLHYGSSRATLWFFDEPYHYRLHVLDEIIDPSVCLAYRRAAYPAGAKVPESALAEVFQRMGQLRLADANLYLRSGSLNVMNGLVGLTFSCDGSHYMTAEEFLAKDDRFWFGGA